MFSRGNGPDRSYQHSLIRSLRSITKIPPQILKTKDKKTVKVTERLLVEIIQNDPKTAISFHSKRPKFMKKDAKNPITVSRVGPRWPTLDKKASEMPVPYSLRKYF